VERNHSVAWSWKTANCVHYGRDPFNFRSQNATYSFFLFSKYNNGQESETRDFLFDNAPIATSIATEQSNYDTPDRYSETGTSNYGTPERRS
jgi:hypothetical protein